MCSRYNLTTPPEAVRQTFATRNALDFPPRYNIAPTQPAIIVRHDPVGAREMTLVRWGLIPAWVKDPGSFTTLINARSETAKEKPSFRAGMRHRRCIVPATGFYEWTGRPGAKRPHMIRPRTGGLLALAGLWEHWLGANGSEIETMAILTVAANPTVERIHDRMPAILPPEAFADWLDSRALDAPAAGRLLRPAAEDLLEIVDVSPALNNPRSEGANLIIEQKHTLI